MGALSAGQLTQAQACVYPGTVPDSTTSGLLAHVGATAVYLPDNAATAGDVFAYQGNGKSVQVTVTKEADGTFWVTAVAVS